MPQSNYEYPGYERSGTMYWLKTSVLYGLLVAGGLWMLGPFYWMVTTALSETATATQIIFLPHLPTLDHFFFVFNELPIVRWFANTLLFAGAVTLFNVMFDSLAGYAIAKLNFWGREPLFILFVSTMMIPSIVTLIPLYLLLAEMNWTNTYQGLIIPFIANPIGIFLMRQQFKDLPDSLGDAAKIDGCSELQTFYRIYLPLSKSAIATLATFTFVLTWNNFTWPLIIANDSSMYTLPVALFAVRSQFFGNWEVVMAASVILVAPMFVAFLLIRDQFIQGMTMGGMKG